MTPRSQAASFSLSPPASIAPTTSENHTLRALALSAMADCYAPEADDLHRRWLPREIFADIGIVDVAPASDATATDTAQDIAVHLTAGIIGGETAALRPPPPPVPVPYQQHHHPAQICGLEGRVLVAYGVGSHESGAPAAWPLSPYSPLQWQVGTNFANGGGGVIGGPLMPAPPRPCGAPPPAKRRLGGTGVFLPRTEYQYQHKAVTKPPPKDWNAANEGPEKKKQQQRGGEKDRQWQKIETAAETTTTTMQQQQSASAALLALPQEWTY